MSAIFSIEALPAKHGDCLLLHYGSEEAPGLILIDGGPSRTWRTSLEPRLKAIRAKRGDRFAIDLLMVSHIDDDHVVGLVEFTKAWREAKGDGQRWPYPVREIWHNSFRRISGADPDKVTASVLASTGGSGRIADLDIDLDDAEDAHTLLDSVKVLASVRNGSLLRNDVDALGIPKNVGFEGGLVKPGAGETPMRMGPDLSLHIVAPLPKQLQDLQDSFAAQLPREDTQLAAYADKSVPNLSSIVALARVGDKTILLTGDARGDYLLEGLEAEGLVAPGGIMHVDVFKLQHHGSDHNAETDVFRRVTADDYLVSADGRFGNPDRATFEMLIEARGKDARYRIHVTYPVAAIDAQRKEEWERKRQSKIDKGKAKLPRAWDDAKDNIADLLSARRAQGYVFEVVQPRVEGASALVNLLDPLTV
jgi:beta-lactamase superfamily II metal-dependent hydrolase